MKRVDPEFIPYVIITYQQNTIGDRFRVGITHNVLKRHSPKELLERQHAYIQNGHGIILEESKWNWVDKLDESHPYVGYYKTIVTTIPPRASGGRINYIPKNE